jgi:biopolymer transport protein ExbD
MAKDAPQDQTQPAARTDQLIVAIDVNGIITVDGEVVSLADLPARLKRIAEVKSRA